MNNIYKMFVVITFILLVGDVAIEDAFAKKSTGNTLPKFGLGSNICGDM